MDLTLEELSDELLFDVFLRLDYFDLSRALIVSAGRFSASFG
jgi:hypothetical protein